MTVEPIRDRQKIKAMQTYLKGQSLRDWLLFNMGINTGLRISDILPLKVGDLMNEKGKWRDYLDLHEQKTGKAKRIHVNDALKRYVKEYLDSLEDGYDQDTYLFGSQKGGHIGRQQAWESLSKAAEAVGVENFGTHSMRKSWGYHSYKESKHNIGLIMDVLNHSKPSITLRYIGINQEQKDDLYKMVQF